MSKSISPDTIVGHYRIVSKIGEGGMGEVYLAGARDSGRKHTAWGVIARLVARSIEPAKRVTELAGNRDSILITVARFTG